MKRYKGRRVSALVDYVAKLQRRMDLHQWHIRVMAEPAPKEHGTSWAVVWIANEANEACLYVNPRFFELTRHSQRQVIVHELCHLVSDRVYHLVRTTHAPLAKNAAGRDAANELLRVMAERVNDDFAWLIAEHMPLPPKGWLD